MYNPDAPTTIGSFLQHTYQQPNQNSMNNSYYYNGGNPFDMYGQQQSDSRRNMMTNNGVNNMNNNMNFGMTNNGYGMQMQTQQQNFEQPVMPFSSYPSGVPTSQQNGMPAFNSLVDSRRNATAVNNNAATTNPWSTANQQQQNFQMNPQQPMMQNNQMMYGQNYDYSQQPMSCSSLYGSSINAFNKKDAYWDNQYTNPQFMMTPTVDWNAATNLNPMGNNMGYQQQQQQYPTMPQYPKTNMSWAEIAERNFNLSTI